MLCKNCSKEVDENSSFCSFCGYDLKSDKNVLKSPKKGFIVLILCILAGKFGIHRLYVGKKGSGIIMLLLSITIVGLSITWLWAIVDALLIVLEEFTDINGKVIKLD